MPNGTPQFVRLPERLVTGNVTDLDSGFHIGGYDVKPVPDKEENPVAHRFVMDRLRQGHLEAATEDEHKVVQESRAKMLEMHLGHLDLGEALERTGHQEQPLQDQGVATRNKLKTLRAKSEVSAEETDAEQAPSKGAKSKSDSSE